MTMYLAANSLNLWDFLNISHLHYGNSFTLHLFVAFIFLKTYLLEVGGYFNWHKIPAIQNNC